MNNDIMISLRKLKPLIARKHVAIYGTGKSAEIVLKALWQVLDDRCSISIIDRDNSALIGHNYWGYIVRKLEEVYLDIDVVLVCSRWHADSIVERVRDYLVAHDKIIDVIDVFKYELNTQEQKLEYLNYLERSVLKQKNLFVKYDVEGISIKENDTKIIAYYLPQFHRLEINDRVHGAGFTEWTNSSRMIPLFPGHLQPHVPYDVGYYDIMNPETLRRQVFLAKHYGIYGFCIHYYWFSGNRIMEKPLERLLSDKSLDIHYCFNWATENWTKKWDGGNKEVICRQSLQKNDAESFMRDVLPFFQDERYIRIDGKPVLLIYKCRLFNREMFIDTMNRFNTIARHEGFPGVYVLLTTAADVEDASEWGCDAIVEYNPNFTNGHYPKLDYNGYINPYFNGTLYDMRDYIAEKRYLERKTSGVLIRSALTEWDNSARRCLGDAAIFYGLNNETYRRWLTDIIIESKRLHPPELNIVFVNSWNEWAEGSHLEPDMVRGYYWLQATKEALIASRDW
ncbi:MAG: glycoside hydrolase family 99-like domain-containing protein [Lachnospiraceae bacterium]|nr:glycoside hydrolase family 99-like domain-containing protein [Lachnospiraceae bacterium]